MEGNQANKRVQHLRLLPLTILDFVTQCKIYPVLVCSSGPVYTGGKVVTSMTHNLNASKCDICQPEVPGLMAPGRHLQLK